MVAHYTEDLNWLGNLPQSIQQTVYDKNPDTPHAGATPLPNVGREAHTYLTHIVRHYDSLSEWTVFCQGKPFDHAYDFKKRLKAWAEEGDIIPDFEWLGHIIDTDDANGERLFKQWSKNENQRGLDLIGFHQALFETESPDSYTFALGAQFIISRELLQKKPLVFYQHALRLSVDFPDAAHCYERSWNRVFGIDTPLLPVGQLTAYLKPIRAKIGIEEGK